MDEWREYYTTLLTLMLVPDTELHRQWQADRFHLLAVLDQALAQDR